MGSYLTLFSYFTRCHSAAGSDENQYTFMMCEEDLFIYATARQAPEDTSSYAVKRVFRCSCIMTGIKTHNTLDCGFGEKEIWLNEGFLLS